MILTPLLNVNIRPAICSWIKQTKNIRPTVKIGKDRFQVIIDVHEFNKDELRVKARPDYVIIEGKQERKCDNKHIMRQFIRKFKLPPGCRPDNIESRLSQDGILTITARMRVCDADLPCETLIPICFEEQKKSNECFVKVDDDPCSIYLKPTEKKP